MKSLGYAPVPLSAHETSFFDSAEFSRGALSTWQTLASVMDHSLVRPEATRDQVLRLCEEAVQYGFATATVNPTWCSTACSAVSGTNVRIGVVIGFPLGASLITTKREEASELVRLGADELGMVLNVGALKSGDRTLVQQEIHAVVEVAHEAGALVKVMLETCLLTIEEKLLASELALAGGADYLETSTGFSTGGATHADVALLRGIAGGRCGIKASGGIRTLADVTHLLQAGATRIGSSGSIAIVREMGAS